MEGVQHQRGLDRPGVEPPEVKLKPLGENMPVDPPDGDDAEDAVQEAPVERRIEVMPPDTGGSSSSRDHVSPRAWPDDALHGSRDARDDGVVVDAPRSVESRVHLKHSPAPDRDRTVAPHCQEGVWMLLIRLMRWSTRRNKVKLNN